MHWQLINELTLHDACISVGSAHTKCMSAHAHLLTVDDLAIVLNQSRVAGIQAVKHSLAVVEAKVVDAVQLDRVAICADDLHGQARPTFSRVASTQSNPMLLLQAEQLGLQQAWSYYQAALSEASI